MASNASLKQGELMPASGRGNSLELRYRRIFETAQDSILIFDAKEPRSYKRKKPLSVARWHNLGERIWNQLSHKMAPCSPCNTDRRKEIIASTVTNRSQALIKRTWRFLDRGGCANRSAATLHIS